MDDAELAARLASDLDGSFETLTTVHADRCYAVALRLLGDRSDAEEVAADALVRAYRALASYDARRIRALRVRAWLVTIVANLARNRLRGRGQRATALGPLVERGLEPVADASTDPVVLTHRRAETERLAAAVLALPERYRIPVVLRHVDELSYDELSSALGRPVGTVKAQVHRGLALLREALTADPVELTA